MAAGGVKASFTKAEAELFEKVYKKLQSSEWTLEAAGRFFKGNQAAMGKFNQYVDYRNSLIDVKVLQDRNAELKIELVALQKQRTFLVQGIQQNEAQIAQARQQFADAIVARAIPVPGRR